MGLNLRTEPDILGSEDPDADVLLYSKGRKFIRGNLKLVEDGEEDDEILLEGGVRIPAVFEYVGEH